MNIFRLSKEVCEKINIILARFSGKMEIRKAYIGMFGRESKKVDLDFGMWKLLRKSILHGRNLIVKGMRFIVGDGSLIDMWSDPWLPLPTHPPRPPRSL